MGNITDFKVLKVMNKDTNKSLANYLGITEKSIINKTNNSSKWTKSEIIALKHRWNLLDYTEEEIKQIFGE